MAAAAGAIFSSRDNSRQTEPIKGDCSSTTSVISGIALIIFAAKHSTIGITISAVIFAGSTLHLCYSYCKSDSDYQPIV